MRENASFHATLVYLINQILQINYIFYILNIQKSTIACIFFFQNSTYDNLKKQKLLEYKRILTIDYNLGLD